ncbi:MAG TPA: TlpA disulfide reductase family protein [Polyangia bacterium]
MTGATTGLWGAVGAVAISVALGVALGGCVRSSRAAAPAQDPARASSSGAGVGDFRDIAVRDDGGRGTTLRSELAGKPALVSLWAPWCAPCVREQPALERLARAAQACGGAVVAIAVGEAPETVATFARSRGLTFRQLADDRFTLADALGRRRIPALMVLDRAGRVVYTGEALDAHATAALANAIRPSTDVPPCAL